MDEAQPGRRQRHRERTEREIKEAAMAEVRQRGAEAVTLRGVARRAGLSPAGMYRYVDSRDALLTWLIADGFHDYADHLESALAEAPAGVAERLAAVALAYRGWAVEHANTFGLLFGDPVPGYHAPPQGETTDAMRRLGVALATPVIEAYQLGTLRVPETLTDESLASQLEPMQQVGAHLPSEVYALLLLLWGRLHGQVILEVFGHHAWLFPDGCEPLYRLEVATLLADLGLRGPLDS